MQFNLETATNNTYVIAARWAAFWDNATAATVDSSIRFTLRDNGAEKQLVRFYGALPGVIIEDTAAATTPNALLDVRGAAIFNENGVDADFRIEGDGDANCFVVDAGALAGVGAVGIGTATPDSKLHVSGKIHGTDELELDGALNHDGTTVGFYGVAPVARSAAYAPTNVTTDRAYDANATTVDELADVLGTLIADLQATGIIGV